MGAACQKLHEHYITVSNRDQANRKISFIGQHGIEPFQSYPCPLIVEFSDLYDLYHLGSLDTGLVKVFELGIWLRARKSNHPIGFLDLEMVCLNNIEARFNEIHDYVLWCMIFHQDKKYIMFPYNQGFHWILVVLIPKWNKLIYLDPFHKGNHTYHPLSNLMQEVWNSYVRQGGKHKTGRDSLEFIEKFKCPQQPKTGNTCAFYVFHHMNKLL